MTDDNTRRATAQRYGLGWLLARIVVPIAVLTAGLLTIAAILSPAEVTELSTIVMRSVGGAVVSILVIGTIVVLARNVDRRPLRAFGISPLGDGWRAFVSGALFWLLPASVMFALLGLLGSPLTVTVSATELTSTVVLLLLAVLLMEAIPEELVFRGYITGVLGERLSGWWVILAQTTLFTGFALLLRGYTGVADLSLFIGMGIGLGYLRMVTGSVWIAVGFHMAFQTGAQLVLTHEVVEFAGQTDTAMLALGAVPFAVAAILTAILYPATPWLFARQS